MTEKAVVWEILVPTQFNDGRPIKTRYHRIWDEKVRAISGGLTILRPAVGQWEGPDNMLYKERMIPVRIMCTEEEINQIADITADYYSQLAVMFYKIGESYIKHYD